MEKTSPVHNHYLRLIQKKLPDKQELFPVISTIIFLVYSRSIYKMFNQVPSWLYYMSIGDILIAIAYILVFALIECLAMLAFLVFLAMLFPAKIFKDKFVVQASMTVYLLTIWGLLFRKYFPVVYYNLELWELIVYPVGVFLLTLLIITLFSYVFDRFVILQRPIKFIADKLTIFAYLYIPLSLLGAIIVIIRNVF